MTKIWKSEQKEQQLLTMDLLKETKYYNKNMSLTNKEDNRWLKVSRIKQ